MAPSGQGTTIPHASPTWKEQLSLRRGTTFCMPDPDHGQKAQQKQRCSSSKPANTVQVGPDHAQKKTAHAAEQDRPDIRKRRAAWFEGQLDLDPERLVFIDETWASTNMARRYGRAPRGRRLRVGVPHGRWKTTTFVAGLRTSGVVAPFVLDGPINRAAFEAYVEKVLVPELRLGDGVILDNLSSHRGPRVRALI